MTHKCYAENFSYIHKVFQAAKETPIINAQTAYNIIAIITDINAPIPADLAFDGIVFFQTK